MGKLEKRHMIIGITILLVIIIGVTYAYWTAVIEGVGTPMEFESAEYKIIFTDGEQIEGSQIEPGWRYTKTFKVESKSKEDFKYNIVIKDLINTFETNGYLQYKITSTNGYNMTEYRDIEKRTKASEMPSYLASDITIRANETHNYTIEFVFHNSEEDQSIDMAKRLSGKLGITGETTSFYDRLLTDHLNIQTRTDFNEPVGGTTINNETTSGVIYKTVNASEIEEGEEIYYFAGNPSDNWVKFGKETKEGVEKDIYWRIIRTNHDKSIRLLYAGNTPDTTEGHIGESKYNDITGEDNNPLYVGWKYGTSGSLENNRTNENSSTIRTQVLEWFNTNIKPNYNKYISYEAIYCNDRSGDDYKINEGFEYAGFFRLYKNGIKIQPSYECGMNTTGKTLSEGVIINHGIAGTLYSDASDSDKFRDGFGLMIADEVTFAGGVFFMNGSYQSPNTYYSRNSIGECSSSTACSVIGKDMWYTMSPIANYSNQNMLIGRMGANGRFGGIPFNISASTYKMVTRPVISIKGDVKITGNGTVETPYEII